MYPAVITQHKNIEFIESLLNVVLVAVIFMRLESDFNFHTIFRHFKQTKLWWQTNQHTASPHRRVLEEISDSDIDRDGRIAHHISFNSAYHGTAVGYGGTSGGTLLCRIRPEPVIK